MEKIKNAKFPESKKEIRAFLGLVNSIRRVIPFKVVKEMQVLTPLTSSSQNIPFLPNEKHKEAFEKIKKMLLSEPLFCNLIEPNSTKYIFVDASTSTGCLGAVLLQRIDGKQGEKLLPTSLDLDDPTHRYIYDHELPYEPCKLYTELPIIIPTPSVRRTIPPSLHQQEKLKGYTHENLKDSLFWSTVSTLALYGGQIIKSIISDRFPVHTYEFSDPQSCIQEVRSHTHVGLADSANQAFAHTLHIYQELWDAHS
jgi:hypothetical protein